MTRVGNWWKDGVKCKALAHENQLHLIKEGKNTFEKYTFSWGGGGRIYSTKQLFHPSVGKVGKTNSSMFRALALKTTAQSSILINSRQHLPHPKRPPHHPINSMCTVKLASHNKNCSLYLLEENIVTVIQSSSHSKVYILWNSKSDLIIYLE